MKILLVLLLLIFSEHIKADLFGGDIGVLIQIASTTVKQLNEMEKLVSSTEKYTEKFQKYNELIEDKYLFARQILFKLERLKALNKNPKDLGEINNLIRSLKFKIKDFEEIAKKTSSEIFQSQDIQDDATRIDQQARAYSQIASQQKSLTQSLNKSVSINKANALSNAYGLEINSLSLQVQTQNLHQNAKQTEYITRKYLEDKLKEKELHEFFMGKTKEAKDELY